MREIIAEQKHVDVIVQFSNSFQGQERYKGIKILYIFFHSKWIQIVETRRIWRVRSGHYYNYYFKVFNHKNTSFTLIYQSELQIWEMLNYEYEV